MITWTEELKKEFKENRKTLKYFLTKEQIKVGVGLTDSITTSSVNLTVDLPNIIVNSNPMLLKEYDGVAKWFENELVNTFNISASGLATTFNQDGTFTMRCPFGSSVIGKDRYAICNVAGTIYYCFITGIEYVNPNNTILTLSTDVWHTFQAWGGVLEEGFISRCTTESPTTINKITSSDYGEGINFPVEYVTINSPIEWEPVTVVESALPWLTHSGAIYTGVPTTSTFTADISGLDNYLTELENSTQEKVDKFFGSQKLKGYMLPSFLTGGTTSGEISPTNEPYKERLQVPLATYYSGQISVRLHYEPYTQIVLSNGQGEMKTLDPSRFDNLTPVFYYYGTLTPPIVSLVPTFYDGETDNLGQAVTANKFLELPLYQNL